MSFLLRLWGRLPIPQRIRWMLVSLFVPKFAMGVAGVILNEENDILLFHHTYRGSRYPWGLPSGWLDPREDPAQGIVREVHEETGLEVRVIRPVLIDNALIIRRVDVIFLCEIVKGNFRVSDEVDAIQFFNQKTLPEMLPAQKDTLERIFKTLNFQVPH